MIPAYIKVKEIHDVTFEGFKRTSVFVTTGTRSPSIPELEDACRLLMTDERIGSDGSVAFFFWHESDPVGEIVAKASLSYCPGGIWESINDDEMKLVVDFYRY